MVKPNTTRKMRGGNAKAVINGPAGGASKPRRELFKGRGPLPEDLAALLEKAERVAVAARILKQIKKGRGKSKDRLDPAKNYARALKDFHGKENAERDARISQPTADFESGEELAAAVLEKCNLVEIMLELVKDGGKTKNPTIRARMLEALLELKFGKIPPATRANEVAPWQIVLDGLPRPQRRILRGEKP
jgi:hypothetical protein